MRVAIPPTPNERTVFFTTVASVSLDDCFDGFGADVYDIATYFSGGTTRYNLRLRAAGADLTTGYYWLRSIASATAWAAPTSSPSAQISDDNFPVGEQTPSWGSHTLFQPAKAINTTILGGYGSDTTQVRSSYQGRTTSASAYDGFTLFVPSGTMSGWVRVKKIA